MRKLIFDLGMHKGEDTEFYLSKGFHVVAVEANPFLCEYVHQKLQNQIQNKTLQIINNGIGDKCGVFEFYINNSHSVWSSFNKEIGSRESEVQKVEIQMLRFENLVSKYGVPYYAKIDIEGYDHYVLESLVNLKEKPKYISVENGFPFMLDLLTASGYDSFKFINQAEISKMVCPKPALEVNEVEWFFSLGSSGPFGEETLGEWQSYDEVLKSIKNHWDNPQKNAWYDLHARHPSSPALLT